LNYQWCHLRAANFVTNWRNSDNNDRHTSLGEQIRETGRTNKRDGMTETGKHKEEREAALGGGMEGNKVEGEEKKRENEKLKQIQNQGGGGGGSNLKGKSCKGYLYYSSTLKSNVTNPRCIGIPRTLRQS
jgi:hypothetical protein